MKPYLFHRLATASLSALLLCTGCDDISGGVTSCATQSATAKAACAPEVVGRGFTITFTPEPGTAGLRFRATGALADEGRVQGDLLRVDLTRTPPQPWHGARALLGANGMIVIDFEGQVASERPLVVNGRFTVRNQGTGAYAGLAGEGTFRAAADAQGLLTETFEGQIY